MNRVKPLAFVALIAMSAQVFAAQPFPAEVAASDLLMQNGGDGSDGVVIKGYVPFEFLGSAISPAGDINSDGADDILISAQSSDQNGGVGSGRVYAVFGNADPQSELELFALDATGGGDGSAGFIADGFQMFGYLGQSVAEAGDMNDDGIDDIILGAGGSGLGNPEWGGQGYLVFGRNGNFAPDFSLQDLFTVNGATGDDGAVFHATGPGDDLGTGVTRVGDVNADGYEDLLLGAPRANTSPVNDLQSTGAAYLLYGSADPFPAESELDSILESSGGDGSLGTYFIGAGIGVRDRTGQSVGYVGDVNADGIDDLSIGAPGAGELQPRGGAYIVFGRQGGFGADFDLGDLLPVNGGDGSQGFFIRGSSPVEHAATYLCSAGDINSDGINDVLVSGRAVYVGPGPFPSETYAVRGYLIFGSDTGFEAIVNTGDLFEFNGGDGSVGFVMTGEETAGSGYASVCGAGDINDDGFDDIILGAPDEPHQSVVTAGRSYVIYGKRESFPAQFDLTSLLETNGGDGSSGFVIHGSNANQVVGATVSPAGDFNNDGLDDVMISAWGAGHNGSGTGAVYIMFGRISDDDADGIGNQQDNCRLSSNPAQTDADGDGFGNACDADFNNDNIVNFIDLSLLGQAFLSNQKLYDLNEDGAVNFLDVSLFEKLFLLPPGPSGLGLL